MVSGDSAACLSSGGKHPLPNMPLVTVDISDFSLLLWPHQYDEMKLFFLIAVAFLHLLSALKGKVTEILCIIL